MVPPVDRTRRPAPAGQGQSIESGLQPRSRTEVPRSDATLVPPDGSSRPPLVRFLERWPVLADLERLFERVFERSTARLFRAHLQAVQLERRVERAMERARVTQGSRTTVPARYRVRLHPDDLADVAAQADGFDALAGRLADAALAFARAHGYHLPGRPSVALVADPSIERGVIEVDAVASSSAHRRLRRSPPGHPAPLASASRTCRPRRRRSDAPRRARRSRSVAVRRVAGHRARLAGRSGRRARVRQGSAATAPRRWSSVDPRPPPTRAVLRVVARDGAERTIEVDGTPLDPGQGRGQRTRPRGRPGLAPPRAASRPGAGRSSSRISAAPTAAGSTACGWTSARWAMGDRAAGRRHGAGRRDSSRADPWTASCSRCGSSGSCSCC